MESSDGQWPSVEKMKASLAVARGDVPAELVLKNGRVVDVFSGKIIQANVAVHNGRIVGLGDYQGQETIDLAGGYIAPSFIDGHMHLESTMLTPSAYAQVVVPAGTGAVAADPHEIANVLGLVGVEWMIRSSRNLAMDFFFNAPSCVPASPMSTSGATLDAASLVQLADHDAVIGLAEVMNFPGVVNGDDDILAKLDAFRGRPIDGHAPLLKGKNLNAYALAGPASDHECMNLEEAADKLSRGIRIMIREGSTVKNMETLVPLITTANSRRMMFVTDDCHADDLLNQGHLNPILAKAVGLGVKPVTAIQMVTLNTAEHFNLRSRGAVSPGYMANLVVLNDLEKFQVRLTLHQGRVVARDGQALTQFDPPTNLPPETMNVRPYTVDHLAIEARKGRVRVIGLVPDQVYTQNLLLEPTLANDKVVADKSRDLAKLVVVERHHSTGNIGLGFVKGFGLTKGAIASSVGHDSHNLIVVGMDDSDMFQALKRVEKMGGGVCVSAGGEILTELALPVAGLISPLSTEQVADQLILIHQTAKKLGCGFDPFMALSFMALEVIPELKLTDQGLVDVLKFQHVDLFEG